MYVYSRQSSIRFSVSKGMRAGEKSFGGCEREEAESTHPCSSDGRCSHKLAHSLVGETYFLDYDNKTDFDEAIYVEGVFKYSYSLFFMKARTTAYLKKKQRGCKTKSASSRILDIS